MSTSIKSTKGKNSLMNYIPGEINVGPYVYQLEVANLRTGNDDNEGECNFRDKKIKLSAELNYDLTKPNWQLTIEVLLHEILHSYNCNIGMHSGHFDFQNKKTDEIEEIFVDFSARHVVTMFLENPALLALFNLLKK